MKNYCPVQSRWVDSEDCHLNPMCEDCEEIKLKNFDYKVAGLWIVFVLSGVGIYRLIKSLF